MRRLLVLVLMLCLAVPTVAWASRRAPGDGTLAVRNGSGYLTLTLRDGVVIGRLEAGVLEVVSQEVTDCSDHTVWGHDRGPVRSRELVDGKVVTSCVFRELASTGSSEATRFRLSLKNETVTIRRGGSGFSLSVIGRGRGYVEGAGGQDGFYSLDGDPFVSLPDNGRVLRLGATLP